MCGRISQSRGHREIEERFNLNLPFEIPPRYNLCPGDQALVIVRVGDKKSLQMMKWGLIPSWAKDPKIGFQCINARAETVETKAAFKDAFFKRRCLVVADGFYEWKKLEGKKIPYRYILPKNQIFTMAGLWDRWQAPLGEVLTFTIVTTDANELVNQAHNRMPVILDRGEEDLWLDLKTDRETLRRLLKPHPQEAMQAYEVSSKVNSGKNDSPELIEPVLPVKNTPLLHL